MGPLPDLLFPAYDALWRAAQPWLSRHKRLADGFEDRLVPDSWPGLAPRRPGRTRIWFQAASGGEARLLQALVPALTAAFGESRSPDRSADHNPGHYDLLCTSCTRQGLDILSGLEAGPGPAPVSAFFPLDRPGLMKKALDQADPDALVLLETELWPGLLRAAKDRGLPVLVLNGRMTAKSRRAYGLLAPFWTRLAPDRVLAVSEADAARFSSLFGPACSVSVMPNIKFDLAGDFAAQAPDKDPLALRRALGLAPESLVLLFASVREQEEALLLPVLSDLYGTTVAGRPLCLVLAPRHMQRLEPWRAGLAAAGLEAERRSFAANEAGNETGKRPGSTPLILYERFGAMPDLYAMADAAFVGGSLAPLGGQNFLEALALGLSPFVGPHTENFAWAGEDFFGPQLARRVPDAAALLAALRAELPALAANPEIGSARRERGRISREAFQRALAPHLGGAAAAARALAGLP